MNIKHLVSILSLVISLTIAQADSSIRILSDTKYGEIRVRKIPLNDKAYYWLDLVQGSKAWINPQIFTQEVTEVIWSDNEDRKKSKFLVFQVLVDGLACPYDYFLMDLRGDKPMFSTEFGNCGENKPTIVLQKTGNITFHFKRDDRLEHPAEYWTYKDGVLEKIY